MFQPLTLEPNTGHEIDIQIDSEKVGFYCVNR